MSQDNDGEKLVLFGEEVNTSSIIGVFKEHWQLMILIVCLVLFGFGVGLHTGFNNCLVEYNEFIFETCDGSLGNDFVYDGGGLLVNLILESDDES